MSVATTAVPDREGVLAGHRLAGVGELDDLLEGDVLRVPGGYERVLTMIVTSRDPWSSCGIGVFLRRVIGLIDIHAECQSVPEFLSIYNLADVIDKLSNVRSEGRR
jgi:hypothetical protein